MSSIRVVAVAILHHPITGALLVDESIDPATRQRSHRPPGGGVEFLELSRDTVTRELREEYDLDVVVDPHADVIQSRFQLRGIAAHELVLVHRAALTDPSTADFTRTLSRDAPEVSATWRDHRHADIALHPEGIQSLIDQTP